MNEQELVQLVERNVSHGVRASRGVVSDDDLRRLVIRVIASTPEDPVAFAFRVGRNWAVDRARRKAAAVRLAEKRRQQEPEELAAALRKWREAEDIKAARGQFDAIVQRLRVGKAEVADRQVEIVRLLAIERRPWEGMAEAFPGSTPAQRWQWKRRGVRLLLRHNPPAELRRVLEACLY